VGAYLYTMEAALTRPQGTRSETESGKGLQRLSLRDAAYDELRRRILALDLAPGAQLVPEDLAADLGVSRTPVREALSLLARDHLVEVAPNGTTWVARPSAAYLSAMADVRQVLEGWAAAEAAGKITPAALDRLEARCAAVDDQLRRTGDAGPVAALDEELHQLVLQTCGNPVLVQMLAPLADYRIWLRRLGTQQGDAVGGNVEEHRVILQALRAGDRERARRAMEAHIEAGKRRQLAVLAALQGAATLVHDRAPSPAAPSRAEASEAAAGAG
jgi:DNA-binding GntR family transcriptional regulator